LRKVLISIALLVVACGALVGCSGYKAPGSGSSGGSSSGLTNRVFVSNPLFPSSAGTSPVLNIINATTDLLSPTTVGLAGAASNPGLMAETPDRSKTLVFSSAENVIAVVANATESGAGSIALPAETKSIVTDPDNVTAYAAVPTAPVGAQAPGAVEVLDLTKGRIKGTIPVASVRTIVQSAKGAFILAFADNSSTVTVIKIASFGTNTDARTPVGGFDHPVSAVFSPDDSKAFILECGPECGGTSAAVTVLDLTTNLPGTRIPVAAASIGFLDGTVIYVAGTPPGTLCGAGTAALTCGELTVISTLSLAVTSTSPILISDGTHDRMVLTTDGQLYIGANHCTNINNPASGGTPAEVRGCLSIFNTKDNSVTVAPDNGDVTGIQSIVTRKVVYVVEGNQLRIYSTTTNKLQTTQVDIVGPAVDVKLAD
jgi:hypothetical protein